MSNQFDFFNRNITKYSARVQETLKSKCLHQRQQDENFVFASEIECNICKCALNPINCLQTCMPVGPFTPEGQPYSWQAGQGRAGPVGCGGWWRGRCSLAGHLGSGGPPAFTVAAAGAQWHRLAGSFLSSSSAPARGGGPMRC